MSKFKSKKFWVSLAGIVIMLIQLFGVKINVPYVTEVVNAICAACVFVGLLDEEKPEQSDSTSESSGVGPDLDADSKEDEKVE